MWVIVSEFWIFLLKAPQYTATLARRTAMAAIVQGNFSCPGT
jgi:hypothetical protein